MSSLNAILAVLGLFVVAFAPLALAVAGIISRGLAAAANAALILGAAGYHAGLVTLQDPRLGEVSAAAPNAMLGGQCAELIAALDQARVIIDRRSPPRLVVLQDRWSQLPEEARGVVLECVQRAWPAGTAAPQLEMRAQ